MGEHSAPAGWLERWQETEPLRLRLYGITVPLLAAAVTYGWLTTEQLGAWTAVAGALFLGSTVAGEWARRKVASPATVDRWLDQTHRDSYSRGVEDALHTTPDQPVTETLLVIAPETTELRRMRRGSCGYIESGRRCVLDVHGKGMPHHYG